MSGKFYPVEALIDKRFNSTSMVTEYLVKWKGYTEDEATWVPYRELKINCRELMN
jgi:hypothetical protein